MQSTWQKIRLSIVSHGQEDLVARLLQTVEKYCRPEQVAVTVTLNTVPRFSEGFDRFSFPVELIHNDVPKGFGANHNAAFSTCGEGFFCVLNPDIRFTSNPFPDLLSCLQDPHVGVVGPSLFDSAGRLQDSARCFPTPGRIMRRVLLRDMECASLRQESVLLRPDWIAGMFMLFPVHIFQLIGGFDEQYYMYCEDADICMRLRKAGYSTALAQNAAVIHDARRGSHRSFLHLRWHLISLLRFFLRYPFYRL